MASHGDRPAGLRLAGRLLAAGPGAWLSVWCLTWGIAQVLFRTGVASRADAVILASLAGLLLYPTLALHALSARSLSEVGALCALGALGFAAIRGVSG